MSLPLKEYYMDRYRANQELDPATREFYAQVLTTLNEAQVPFLVGGAYAFERYTGITRHTKDLDVLVRPRDAECTLEAFAATGYRTELTYPHWLGKAFYGGNFIDVIFRSSNGVSEVSDTWFEHAIDDSIYGVPLSSAPPKKSSGPKCSSWSATATMV
jgi:hypothetical protein